jgi:flavin prenyltransferase
MKKVLVAMGGASGSIYGIKLLEILKKSNVETHLIISNGAKKIIEYETKYSHNDVLVSADFTYENDDLFAGPASGSFSLDEMVICPCSMKTLSAVANGYGDTLTTRAACCVLKESKTLILVPRETPIDLTGLKNMVKAKEAGAIILPAMPGFYHKPKSIDEVVNFIVGKILNQLEIKHHLYQSWGSKE